MRSIKVKINDVESQLTVVGCQHGNERFGKVVIDDVHADTGLSVQVRTILANERAYELNRRWIDTDLNRSFNRSDISGHEADIAPSLLAECKKSQYILDIHTTKADERFIPIVTNLTKGVRYILSHLEAENVAFIKAAEAPHSLIGNHPAAVSLEFGEEYSESDKAAHIAMNAIKGVLSGEYGDYRSKRIYEIDSLIPNTSERLPDGLKSGDFSTIHDGYVLMPRATTYQGFLAKNVYDIDLMGGSKEN